MFDKHARRVRCFAILPRSELNTIARDTLEAIGRHVCASVPERSHNGFFPTLTALVVPWDLRHDAVPTFTPTLCGSSLNKIKFIAGWGFFHPWPSDELSGLSELECLLAERCCGVRVLEIQYIDREYPARLTRLEFVAGLSNLRQFSVGTQPTSALLEDLSRSSTLQSLSFVCFSPCDRVTRFSAHCFPSLTCLSIGCSHLPTIIPLLDAIGESPSLLRDLRIHIFVDMAITGQAEQWPRLLATISRLSSLRLLEFSCWTDVRINMAMLSRLFPLRSLTTLAIRSKSDIYLNDQELQDIASTWPHLQSIQLSVEKSFGNLSSTITFAGLSGLYYGCQNLAHIDVACGSLGLPSTSRIRLPSLQRTPLSTLTIQCAPREAAFDKATPAVVAMVICLLFPSVQRLELEEPGSKVAEQWVKYQHGDWMTFTPKAKKELLALIGESIGREELEAVLIAMGVSA